MMMGENKCVAKMNLRLQWKGLDAAGENETCLGKSRLGRDGW